MIYGGVFKVTDGFVKDFWSSACAEYALVRECDRWSRFGRIA